VSGHSTGIETDCHPFVEWYLVKSRCCSSYLGSEKDFKIIVITNQPDVKYGKLSKYTLKIINSIIMKNFSIDDIFVCIHGNEDNCDCRKPKPGLLKKASEKWNIDLKKSFFIGDRWKDIESGECMGCKTIFIDYNYDELRPRKCSHKFKNISLMINNIKKIL
jgi:D-glycero-D-manno-heptose 1,7-bisphosphate phosphatase